MLTGTLTAGIGLIQQLHLLDCITTFTHHSVDLKPLVDSRSDTSSYSMARI
jgi:hypothetical protein